MKFIKYAEHVNAPQYVIDWVQKNIKEEVSTEEGEHVIDYLVSEEAPKRLESANYKETKQASDKWLKTQIKKGKTIKETESDTEVALDFGDGFRVVKLLGENAYKREGFLMSHCVASYYGKDVEVYSLRDKDNMPHCTMERDQQIKGKGNGDIAPRYIDYVVKFLESIDMSVGDNEMKHLGYINIEKLLPELADDTVSMLYNSKYFPIDKGYQSLMDKNGNQYMGMDLLDYFPMLVEEKTDTSFRLKLAFNMSAMVEYHKKVVKELAGKLIKNKDIIEDLKDYAKMSGGDYAKMSGGNYAKMSGGNYAKMSGGDSAKMSGGDYAQMIAGSESTLESNKHSIIIGDNKCKAKGKLGTLLVLTNRGSKDGEWVITDYACGLVDGKKIKEDVWYTVENGKFKEVII